MKVLILEDDSVRVANFKKKFIGHEITISDNTKEVLKLLYQKEWDLLYLDHDLNGKVYVPSGPGTGYEVAEWLKNNPQYSPKEIYVHTLNEKGRKAILDILPKAIPAPFTWCAVYTKGLG